MESLLMDTPDNANGYVKERFELTVKRFFLHLKNGSQVPWDSVSIFVADHFCELVNEQHLECFCNCMIDILLEYPCPDTYLVEGIVNLYSVSFCECSVYEPIMRTKKILRVPSALKCLIYRPSSYSCSQFWENYPLENLQTFKGLIKADVKFMQLLVRYGISYDTPLFNLFEDEFGYDILLKFVWHLLFLNFEDGGTLLLNAYFMAEDFFRGWTFLEWPNCGTFKPTLKRMHLIKKGVDAILRNLKGEMSDYNKCLRLHFQTIADPFPTVAEVRGFLITFLNFFIGDVDVNDMCDIFSKMFPESRRPYGPRTLKHLSRCEVRVECRRYGSVPKVVQDLIIPVSLKEYLLCETL